VLDEKLSSFSSRVTIGKRKSRQLSSGGRVARKYGAWSVMSVQGETLHDRDGLEGKKGGGVEHEKNFPPVSVHGGQRGSRGGRKKN